MEYSQLDIQPVNLGGVKVFKKLEKEIKNLLNHKTAYVTTMIDYYGLDQVKDFPGLKDAHSNQNFYERADFLEKQLNATIKNNRFFANLIVHEFEALLFSDLEILSKNLKLNMNELQKSIQSSNGNPEAINNSSKTAPSKRLEMLTGNRYKKVFQGNLISQEIGFQTIYTKCSKFRKWVDRFKALTN